MHFMLMLVKPLSEWTEIFILVRELTLNIWQLVIEHFLICTAILLYCITAVINTYHKAKEE